LSAGVDWRAGRPLALQRMRSAVPKDAQRHLRYSISASLSAAGRFVPKACPSFD
jgi:hypothetical protein